MNSKTPLYWEKNLKTFFRQPIGKLQGKYPTRKKTQWFENVRFWRTGGCAPTGKGRLHRRWQPQTSDGTDCESNVDDFPLILNPSIFSTFQKYYLKNQKGITNLSQRQKQIMYMSRNY